MAQVVINVPIVVNCTVTSVSNAAESAFQVDHTDIVELTDIVVPSKITVTAGSIVVVE